MLTDDSSMTIVSREKNGTYRENSLYNFMMDNLSTRPLADYLTHVSRGERQALYIELRPVAEQSEAIFPGFKLVRQHLSVDQCVINESSPLSRSFSPSHGTFEYENAIERRVVHAYFNRHGQFIDFRLKSYEIGPEKKVSGVGVKQPISDRERKLIREQALPCQVLLMELLNQKSNAYIALYQDSFKLDEELSLANASKDFKTAIRKAEQLITLTSALSRYNDTKEDGRTINLTHMLASLNEQLTATPVKVGKQITPDVENKLMSLPVKSGKKKSSPELKQQALRTQIELLVHEVVSLTAPMRDCNVCIQVVEVEEKLRELDTLFLCLEFNGNGNEFQTFIHQQRAQLPVDKNLSDYFKGRVLAGDSDGVRILYPTFSQHLNMFQLCDQLISAIQNAPEQCMQLIEIADYLYEHSEIYRSIISLKGQMLNYSTESQTGFGFLFDLFKRNNLSAFRMALRHGVSTDSIQYMRRTNMFNSLQTLIIFYKINPNLNFIGSLIEYGAQMYLPMVKGQIASPDFLKQMVKKSPDLKSTLHNKVKLVESNSDELGQNFDKLKKIDHALSLACDNQSPPDLIIELAQHSSPEILLLEASNYLNLKVFITRFIPTKKLEWKIFPGRDECDAYTLIPEIIQNPSSGQGCCFVFYLKSGITTQEVQALYTCTNHLLTKAMEGISLLELNEQRQIMKNFTTRAGDYKHLNNYKDAIFCYKAAQMVYTTMKNPSALDHYEMARHFVLVAVLVKEKFPSQSFQAYYSQANEFLKYIPDSEFKQIEHMPFIQVVKRTIADSESTAHFGRLGPGPT